MNNIGGIKNNISVIKKVKSIAAIMLSVILAGSLSGCFLLPAEEVALAPPLMAQPKITYQTVEAKLGTIENKIVASATFVSTSQEALFFKYMGGNLKSINVKIGDKVKKGDLLAELDTDTLVSNIKQQEIVVKLNELQLEKIKANPEPNTFDLQAAQLNLQSVRLKLDDMKRTNEKSKLYSTITGFVVYLDAVNAGDYVNVNKTLITVADPTKLHLKYSGDQAGKFLEGTPLDIKFKGDEYKGAVIASPFNNPADANKNAINTVYIRIDKLATETNIGDTAEVTLTIAKKENVIVISKNLINTYTGRNYVQVMENNVKYERDVELGLETATEVEIVKGIKEGDKLIQR